MLLSTLAPADDELVGLVYLPREWLQEIIDLPAEKRQLIFYGSSMPNNQRARE
jgi:hypothetical protein